MLKRHAKKSSYSKYDRNCIFEKYSHENYHLQKKYLVE